MAELELLVGNARGKRKVDPSQCFQLLQKLVVTLDRTARLEVREYQRRCEDALIDILLKGAPPPVRKLGLAGMAWEGPPWVGARCPPNGLGGPPSGEGQRHAGGPALLQCLSPQGRCRANAERITSAQVKPKARNLCCRCGG